ncbi:hypothetical protein J6590_087227 [Homalodisca vitripennis]|nr:hypothetical protein J6590_087227 [Homalodisca vitripennis]
MKVYTRISPMFAILLVAYELHLPCRFSYSPTLKVERPTSVVPDRCPEVFERMINQLTDYRCNLGAVHERVRYEPQYLPRLRLGK